MTLRSFDRIKHNKNFLPAFQSAINELLTLGVFDFLREVGTPKPVPASMPNLLEVSTMQHAYHSGYAAALDNLLYFAATFLPETVAAPALTPLQETSLLGLEESGDLTKEEVDELRKQLATNTFTDE